MTDNLGQLSEAEWEYAHRYRDYLELGEERPDRAGWDTLRIREIERRISAKIRENRDSIYRNMGNLIS